jgi:ribosomal protein S18 acetylase RimI-like enzyme
MRADDAGDTGRPWGAAPGAGLAADARLLEQARRESVETSDGAFLAEVSDINAKSAEDWENELLSSTWVVLEQGDKVLGIAAAKEPTHEDGQKLKWIDERPTRFIESVWIDPSTRRRGFGERLVKYLIDVEREKGIHQFLLWVFVDNKPAIGLYDHMRFEHMGEYQVPSGATKKETLYRLLLDSDEARVREDLTGNADDRQRDWRNDRASYRLLGEEKARSSPKYSKASLIESTRGNFVR